MGINIPAKMNFKEFIREVGEVRKHAKAGLIKNRLRIKSRIDLKNAEQKLAGLENVRITKTTGVGRHKGKTYTHITIERPVIISGVEYEKAWTGPIENKKGVQAAFKAKDKTTRYVMQSILDDLLYYSQKDPQALLAVINAYKKLQWDLSDVVKNAKECRAFTCIIELLLFNQGEISELKYQNTHYDAKVNMLVIAAGIDDLKSINKNNLQPFERDSA